jgi:hypothetical protein
MADSNNIPGDLRVGGLMTCKALAMQNASITDAMIVVAAAIAASKLQQQKSVTVRQATGSVVVSKTEDAHIVFGASGFIYGVEIAITTAPTGDHTVTVDVQIGVAGVFTTALTGTVVLNSSTTASAVISGALIASPVLAAGNIIRVIVTAAGATSSQGQGLVVTVTTKETPD